MKRAALDMLRSRRQPKLAQRPVPAASGTVPDTCPLGTRS